MATNIWNGSVSTNWGTAGNWSTAVPVSTDAVVLTNSPVAINLGLAQSGVTLASFLQDMSYTGLLGTATSYLNIGATTFNLGRPVTGGGQGSRRINIQAANSGATVFVWDSATSANDTTFTPVRLLLTAATLNVDGGTTGVALYPGETSSISALNITQGASQPTVILGAGVTLTTATMGAGNVFSYSTNTTTTATMNGPSNWTHYGSGAYTTVTVGQGSTLTYPGTGTITTLNLRGTADFSGGTGAVTITNCTMQAGAVILDPLKRVTFTNPVLLSQCRPNDVTINTGYNRSVQFS